MRPFHRFSRVLHQASFRRSLAIILIITVTLVAWSFKGAGILSVINPSLEHELAVAEHSPLAVWVTYPSYANISPIIISTPAGIRFDHDVVTIPEGSILSAHLAEQDGDTPELVIDGTAKEFTTDAHGDFAITEVLTAGKKVMIRRGWETLASWKIRVIPDSPPEVSMTEPPSIVDNKSLRIAYNAFDYFGVTNVSLRITPQDYLPGAHKVPFDIALPVTTGKQISRTDLEDLDLYPWAGQKVTLQIVATNEAGNIGVSDPVDFIIPERHFFHPVARILIEERNKLLQDPNNEMLYEEIADLMAAIAHEAGNYRGDPVVLMALRTGAVRLVLNHNQSAVIAVNDLLWQAATRIESGNMGTAEHTVHDAWQDLANTPDSKKAAKTTH